MKNKNSKDNLKSPEMPKFIPSSASNRGEASTRNETVSTKPNLNKTGKFLNDKSKNSRSPTSYMFEQLVPEVIPKINVATSYHV